MRQVFFQDGKQDHGLWFKNMELVHGGEDYFSRLDTLISAAEKELHIQTYIFEHDSTGKKVGEALKAAAARNVKVYLLLDGYGSASLPRHFIDDLTHHGIHLRFFSPFLSLNSLYLGRRLHHKVVVADGHHALIGGINIADKYRGSEDERAWLDYAVQFEGEMAQAAQELCRSRFQKRRNWRRRQVGAVFHSKEEGSARILRNDWLMGKNQIQRAYLTAIRHAEREVTVVASYFLPGKRLSRALRQAAKRKVNVRLVLSGVSDVPLLRRATSYLYGWLLRHSIELYEWPHSVLHAKVAVADGEWATVGSFNLNSLSSYGSIELNVEIRSGKFSTAFGQHLDQVIARSEHITPSTLQTRSGLFTKAVNGMAYHLIRAALMVLTYVPYRRFLRRFQSE